MVDARKEMISEVITAMADLYGPVSPSSSSALLVTQRWLSFQEYLSDLFCFCCSSSRLSTESVIPLKTALLSLHSFVKSFAYQSLLHIISPVLQKVLHRGR